jgi:hypothetical protein
MSNASPDDKDEKPLDPAVERVRRKLLRFVAINLGLLFAAVMVVVAAVVYRSAGNAPPAPTEFGSGAGEPIVADLPIPQGARIVSHGISGMRVSVDVELADGQRMLIIYDLPERRVIARLTVTPQ